MPYSQRTASRRIGGVVREYEIAQRERERDRERRKGGEKGEVRARERREVASLSLG